MELKDLNLLKEEIESKYLNGFSFGERRLPKSFKELITRFDNDRITFNEFTFKVQRTSEGIIVAPNQWLYIAAFYSSYYKELVTYKEELYNYLLPMYGNKKNALEEPIKGCLNNSDNAKLLLKDYPDNKNKEYLIRFLSDYKWWGGAKTINRMDFCTSAILSSAGLVNVAQGYVADICKFLAENPEAENILLAASIPEENNYTTTKSELLRHTSATTFLKEALKLVIGEDANLSRLGMLNKYKETKKQLEINEFNLWRKKDDLPPILEDVWQDIEIKYNGQVYVMYLDWTPADMESKFFPVFNSAYNVFFCMGKEKNEYVLYKLNQLIKKNKVEGSLQQIFYGAPGTGKSHEINRLTEGEEVIRTTFHPDSEYSTFVGCYKPHMEEVDKTTVIGKELIVVNDESGQPKKEKRIVYKYSCQAFLQAYIAAWQNPNKAQYLVIEEINRGNCAQIFGDIFQLLDRNDEGYSSYPVKTDADAENELRTLFYKEWNLTEEKAKEIDDLYSTHYSDGITKDIKNGSLLLLPKNLYIWATMNTSDQSLFPIDSAFKRRWDWKYVKIKNEHKDWKVDIDIKTKDSAGNETTAKLDWYEFIDKINEIIASMTSSADKQLGYFFCKPKTKDSKEIDAETFVSKVIFYLWNDVFKDYAFEDASLFQYTIEVNGNKETKDLTFPDFYNDDESINTTCLTDFIEKVLNWKKGNEDKE